MTPELCIDMALLYLPKDGTDWRPLCAKAITFFENSTLPITHRANVPAQVALNAFDNMGRDYMDKHAEWRGRLGSVAYRHDRMALGEDAVQ